MTIQTHNRSSRPLKKDSPNYKRCKYNFNVKWGDRSITHEPLNIFGHDAKKYVQNMDRNMTYSMNLDRNGSSISQKLKKKLQCMINAAKVISFHNTVQYMYGVHIPHDTKEVTENYAKHIFQAPCSCSKSGLTKDLLLFKTVNVSVDRVVIKYLISFGRKYIQ